MAACPCLRITDHSCTSLQCICISSTFFFFQLTLFIACFCYIVLMTIYHSTSIKVWLRSRHYDSPVILKKSSLLDIPQLICDSIHKLFIKSNISDFLSVALRLNLRHLLLLKNCEYTLLNSILKHCIEP